MTKKVTMFPKYPSPRHELHVLRTITDSPQATVLHHVENYPTLSRVEDGKPHFSETRQSMLIRRLPKTQIQPFDGNPMNWPLFSNVFQTSVHNVLEHDSDRLTLLKELLTPRVRQTIARFLFNPSLKSVGNVGKKLWKSSSDYRSRACCH